MPVHQAHRTSAPGLLRSAILMGLLAFAGAPLAEQAANDSPFVPVKPVSEQSKASALIARQLEYTHFRQQRINPALSSRVFDGYLNYLDEQRLYLMQSDIDSFEPFRYRLDGALRAGQLDPAFRIFNTYQERMIDRLWHILALLDRGMGAFDFTKDEYLTLDRKGSPWAKDMSELDDLWRRRVKNAILGLRLDGKSDDEILSTLRKRFEHQLNRAKQVRSEDAFQAWMNAFTGVWDPHTQYFSPRTSENFNINMSLSLEGIGAVLQSDNEYTKVQRLVPGGPAALQGQLKPADRIVGVGQGADGDVVNVTGWRLDEVVDLIRGPKSSTVRLQVVPAGAVDETRTRLISIVRDEVKLEDQAARAESFQVDRDGRNWSIGVIQIPTFYSDFKGMQEGNPEYKSTTRDVARLIAELKAKNVDGVVIDLRNNGGGALQEANALVGLFIEKGPTVQIRSADNEVDVLTDRDPEVVYDGPLVVLVNRMSASASEIFAGAIQDYGRGVVVGSQTFGKGTVQAVRPLNHGQLKITQSMFYRVSGASTQHQGVLPDIDIPSTINGTEIGEDALPDALPWHSIAPVAHKTYYQFGEVMDTLRERHQARFSKHPEYRLLTEEIQFLDTERERKQVSLNEVERRKEQQATEARQLAIVNQRRALKGQEPFKDWQAFEAHQEARAGEDESEILDFIVREGGQILVDLLMLDRRFASVLPSASVSQAN